jgi:enoyl-CoA hydratase/carnithine racemase
VTGSDERTPTAEDHIRYKVRDRVAVITLDRAERRNTVTYPMLDRLLACFGRADQDDAVRVVVVTGAGEFFSAGTDLSAGDGYDTSFSGFKPLRGGTRDVGGELAIRVFNSRKPVIAAVNGTAVGIGVSMILPMDIRIAAEDARFGLPFVRRGIVPESCSTWFLPRIVGISRAVEWAVTGRTFPATEALAAGLVRELHPADAVLGRAVELAGEIAASTSAVSVALTRRMLWQQLGVDHPMHANVVESRALLALGAMADAREGVAAFREKRPAEFTLTVGEDLPAFVPWWDEPTFPGGG